MAKVALARVAKANLEKLPDEPGILGVFQRLAKDPKLTVDKLGELIKLQERILDRESSTAFDLAYKAMLPNIPRITKRGIIKNKEGRIQSRYAKFEDIRRICDPILLSFGFTIRFRTEWPETGTLEVVGELVHERGGRRESRFRTTADASGGKNAIQGLGSGVSYGQRYTYKDLLVIVEEGVDDDGQAHGKAVQRSPETRTAPQPAHHAASREVITQAQRQRLAQIVSNSGRSGEEMREWLHHRYGLSSSQGITRDTYNEICAAVEASGPLPMREPGE